MTLSRPSIAISRSAADRERGMNMPGAASSPESVARARQRAGQWRRLLASAVALGVWLVILLLMALRVL